jgi:uncharacterized protein YegP (UPF0339 family)
MAKRLDTISKKKKFFKGKWFWYFTRKAGNGEKLPASQMYTTRQGRNTAVRRIQEAEKVIVEKQPN